MGAGERFAVNEERIWLDALPEVFGGLRVVQISDIHHGLFLPKAKLIEAVQQTNRLRADIVVLLETSSPIRAQISNLPRKY